MRNVVIVDGFRTPLCKEGTDFRETDAEVLGAWVVREMVKRCHGESPLETIDGVLGAMSRAHARGQSDAGRSCLMASHDDSRRHGGWKNCGSE
jgi:acetyl-CoA acetyltransferase